MKTVFILGAGASKHCGYPLGTDLKNDILSKLGRNGGEIYRALLGAGNTEAEIADFEKSLFRADYETIDQFIGAHKRNPHIQRICKQAIVISIAGRENETQLFNAGWHWYKRMIDFLRSAPSLLNRDHISIITFNYDRSLEHYLHETVSRGGGDFSENYLRDFFYENFLHVHGSVGPLPWQSVNGNGIGREYCVPIPANDIRYLADNIITPDEGSSIPSEWKANLLASDVVAFIGFGFHPKNLAKIGFGELVAQPNIKILATTHQLDETKIRHLATHRNVTRINLDGNNFVGQFLDRYNNLDDWLESWRKDNQVR